MSHKFDLIAIGTGLAGAAGAHTCKMEGWDVGVIDYRPYGGTCALRGCNPKKVLVAAADVVNWHRRMVGYGVSGTGTIEWPELMRFKRTFTSDKPESTEQWFDQAGIRTFRGKARFTGPNTIVVGDDELEGKYILIATGAIPAPQGIPGEEYITTSDQFMELDTIPRRIIFIGGGYISFEFAHVAARAGANVTILHRSDRVLKQFDMDMVNKLVEASRDAGIEILTNVPVRAVERQNDSLAVITSTKDGSQRYEADLVVHGAGRLPEIAELDLDKAGVKSESRGILVNEYLQSSNPSVYAAGDAAASGPPLSPVAGIDGRIAALNILKGNHVKTDYTVVPSVVFTEPPLAAVGLSEDQAQKKGIKFEVKQGDTGSWATSRRVGLKHSAHKVLLENDKVIGAHLLGYHAEEVINIFALAMRTGTIADELKRLPWAYPTSVSDIPYML